MSIRITHVRFAGTTRDHQHIAAVRWVNREDSTKTEDNIVSTIVAWIDKGGKAYSGTGSSEVAVGVVREAGQTPYLRTYADKQWNNNLLSLPTF